MGPHGRAAGAVRRLAGRRNPCRRLRRCGSLPRAGWRRSVPLRQTGALESYCGSRSAISVAGGANADAARPSADRRARNVEAREADLPLVVRTARGFGQVIFVAADLDQPPLSKWSDRPLLVARLLDMPTGRAEESEENAAMMHYGYNDLAGQLRSALDRFTGVRLVPFWLVAGLIVVYILLIGPGDYFFLRKLVGRMEWTWLTFPAGRAAGVPGGLRAGLSAQGRSASGQPGRSGGRGRGLGPDARHDVAERLQPADGIVQFLGRSRGGSRRRSAVPGRDRPRVDGLAGTARQCAGRHEPARRRSRCSGPNSSATRPTWTPCSDVPIQVWSTKSLTARWDAPTPALPRGRSDRRRSAPFGHDHQHARLSRCDECILAYGRSVYELGTLAPGESARLGPMTKRSELKTLLDRPEGRLHRSRRQVSPGSHALRPVEHGPSLHPADDDVLRGGRRAPLHRPVERLPGVSSI